MKRFTELLEGYKEEGLKFLSKINEEPTEDEFNKEFETAKDKANGKIRNKNIAKPAVQAVEIDKNIKEDKDDDKDDDDDDKGKKKDDDDDDDDKMNEEFEDLFEKTLTPAQKAKAEEVVKSMKGDAEGFQKRYGDNWKNVMYGTATAIAKKSA